VSPLKNRADIDGLRALAVISVVFSHVSPQNLSGGALGVDIFFVISGYLISLFIFQEQAAGTFTFGNFFSRRVRRLFPALAVVLFSVIVFGWFALFADEYQRLGKHSISVIFFILNFKLLGENDYFDVASNVKPLLHLWSLSVEEQFYFFWPAVVVILGRFRLHMGLAICLSIFGSFAFAIYQTSHNSVYLYYHPLVRFWELLIGAALAFYHHRFGINAWPTGLNQLPMRHLVSVAGLIVIVVSLLFFDGKALYPGALTLAPLMGVVMLIASGSNSLVGRLLSLKPLVWIGLISYPLYLWHWPVLSYIRIMESGAPPEVMLWIGAGVACVLATLTYKFVEQPLRYRRGVRSTLAGLCGTMVVLLLTSFYVMAYDGLPDRAYVKYVKNAEALTKREPMTDESCLGLFTKSYAPFYCRQHNPGGQMIGIIGDSHAHVLFPGIAEIAAREGYGTLLLANSSCPPLMDAPSGNTESEQQECMLSIEKILSTMAADGRIKHVIVATRGPLYLTGRGYGPAEVDLNFPPIAYGQSVNRNLKSGMGLFADGLIASLERLLDAGKTVSYFLQVPELGVPARNCFGRPLWLVSKSTCAVPLSAYQERMNEYRGILTMASVALPKLQVWDPLPLFCNQKNCNGLIQNKLMYADDDHLNVEGSRLVASHFFPFVTLHSQFQEGMIK